MWRGFGGIIAEIGDRYTEAGGEPRGQFNSGLKGKVRRRALRYPIVRKSRK